MKTPDEIKKGLACISVEHQGCAECPYRFSGDCDAAATSDALAYVQQLEADLEIAKIQNQYISEVASAYEKDIEKLEHERDDALKMLKAAFSFPEV